MPELELRHFERAISDIASSGDNDVLPFDVDTRFVGERAGELAELGLSLAQFFESVSIEQVEAEFNTIGVFSERLLAPAVGVDQ